MTYSRITALTDAKVEFGKIPSEHWHQPDWIDEEKATKSREDMVKNQVIYGGTSNNVITPRKLFVCAEGVCARWFFSPQPLNVYQEAFRECAMALTEYSAMSVHELFVAIYTETCAGSTLAYVNSQFLPG